MRIYGIQNYQQNNQTQQNFGAIKIKVKKSRYKSTTQGIIDKARRFGGLGVGLDKNGHVSYYIMTRQNTKTQSSLIKAIDPKFYEKLAKSRKAISTVYAREARTDITRNKAITEEQPKIIKINSIV